MNDTTLNLLALDTATEACSVALSVGKNCYSRFEICPQQHSQKILEMVKAVLDEAGIDLHQIKGIAFGQGPGSFTGVRIATGIIQGLAYGANLPVFGVSTLATMAQQAVVERNAECVISAIDARMSEVYFGIYNQKNGLVKLINNEQVLAPEIAQTIVAEQSNYVSVGTGWREDLLVDPVKTEILYPNAKFMLPIAQHAWNENQFIDVMDISPVYLRNTVTWKKLPGRE